MNADSQQSPYRPRKFFTIEQANACLPLVRSIVADMIELARSILDRRERLDRITQGRKSTKSDMYSEELAQIEEEIDKDLERLKGFAQELLDLGVEPKGAAQGLVDFPHLMDGRPVFLCWMHGEPEVLHWHEIDGGFAGRQSLVAHASESGPVLDRNGFGDAE